MKRAISLLLLPVLLVACSNTSAFAEPAVATRPPLTKSEALSHLKEALKNDAFHQKMNPYKKGTNKNRIYAEYSYNLANNDRFLRMLVDTFWEYKDTKVDVKKLFYALLITKLREGTVKLPDADLNEYFSIYGQMLGNSENLDECVALSKGDIGSRIYTILERMDDEILVSWLRIASKAVFRGLEDQTEPPTITKEQQEIAWQIVFAGLKREQFDKIARIADNFETASPVEQCWVTVFFVDQINSMKGKPKNWAVRSLINGMFK
jgi:hypothetical protein